jgi:uroporphyrinogen decarboxylase
VAEYLNAQIDAGAQAVMIFDSWGGALADGAYQQFSLAYMQQVVSLLKRERRREDPGHRVHQGRRPLDRADRRHRRRCAGPGLDRQPDQARALVGDKVALQGNLDPAILFASPEQITAEVHKVLDAFGKGSGHVFNLGHGISQFTPPENVAAMVEAVHSYSKARAPELETPRPACPAPWGFFIGANGLVIATYTQFFAAEIIGSHFRSPQRRRKCLIFG